MNILIPHTWLLEHLETDVTSAKLVELLSLSGPSVEHVNQHDGETVYDIEVTTNRVDSMSIRGVARETAVILANADQKASLKELKLPEIPTPEIDELALPKIVNDPKLCKRVMCVILKNVQRAETPDWMADRLRQIEQNVHHAAIDITNYITHELGHPCHAFDYDKVMAMGGEIIVTEAETGKTFVTLDGEAYQTVGGEVVFENSEGEIIDLPAIKGTANTSIDESTKNVLLWIESLDAQKVRFGSMTHAIRTVAAQLNEKHVDPHLALPVMQLGVKLYRELCQAQVASQLYDDFPGEQKPESVRVKLETIDHYLGKDSSGEYMIDSQQINDILTALGCEVDQQGERLEVTPPTYRPDIQIPADVVEEIARIYGYHNLPSVVMPTAIPLVKPKDTNFTVENRIKRFLSDIGWYEVYTYSLVSEELARQSGFALDEHLKLANPLTDDRVYLRRSLLPSLEEVLANNPEYPEAQVFEIASLYPPQKNTLPAESVYLSLVSTKPYRQVRGVVEALLDTLFVEGVTVELTDDVSPQFAQEAVIKTKGDSLGKIGVLKTGRIAVNIHLPELLAHVGSNPVYTPPVKTAAITEDITFSLPTQTNIGSILQSIKSLDQRIVGVLMVGDIYKSKDGNNVTFNIVYQDPEMNLSSADVEPIRKQIASHVQKNFEANLVGSL